MSTDATTAIPPTTMSAPTFTRHRCPRANPNPISSPSANRDEQQEPPSYRRSSPPPGEPQTHLIRIKFHHMRLSYESGEIHPLYVPTGGQIVDVLTKPLSRELPEKFAREMGLDFKGPIRVWCWKLDPKRALYISCSTIASSLFGLSPSYSRYRANLEQNVEDTRGKQTRCQWARIKQGTKVRVL